MRVGIGTWAPALHPLRHRRIREERCATRTLARLGVVAEIEKRSKTGFNGEDVVASVTGREKHLWSIYQKMKLRGARFKSLMDVFAFRIVVDSVGACYGCWVSSTT
ncbi:MAG: bifunctional (p)ppGpp synthetase/guanosine-3',5'-bis(diphosphate) 3'-pyrophosphohydrolase [Gammaproteobacteria bacterium]|nr:bifunctional (p)ppGpp synthetase/guanosine-3',5'-bis(diphosphate) 3'-pyrophosphohydrolase [Gammaproteobacteria bacterium]